MSDDVAVGLGAFPALRRLARGGRRHIPHVQSHQSTDCAAACLAMAMRHHGRFERLDDVRTTLGIGRDGVTAKAIVEAADRYGLRARGLRIEVEDLAYLRPGSILHWEFNHFVVFESLGRGGVTIVDPVVGRRTLAFERVRRSFTGVAIDIEVGDAFETRSAGVRPIWNYLRQLVGQRTVITPIIMMSATLRLLALAVPALTAVIVDQVVPHADHDLLWLVAGALVVAALFQSLSQLIRSHLLLQLRTNLDTRMTLGFLAHLVELPFEFFQRRSAGDLLMRVGSNSTIREMLTSSTLSALLDGVLVVTYLGLIAIASPRMAGMVLGLGVAQVVVFLSARRRYGELMKNGLEAQARSQGYLVQLVGGIETLKTAGAEPRAVEHWSNLFVDELNVSLQRGRLSAVVDSGLDLLRSVSPLFIMTQGALMVLGGELSLGTMLALSTLATGVLMPLSSLVASGLQLQLLDGYIERIEDVLNTQPEQDRAVVSAAPRLRGEIRLQEVSFRYAPRAPRVVRGASLDIEPGSSVAIVGRSGAGKSTLANLLIGLHRPTEGTISFDGRNVADLEVRSVRRQIGVVPQHPYIFGSSIRHNITMGDEKVALDRVIEAAHAACIGDDIEAMPMGYDTILADGGASLSGGQRQRIALARALVHQPSIVLLDEATSSLDATTERAVTENLRRLQCTRVLIAHRLSTIVSADKIVVMEDGRIVESGTHDQLILRRGPYRSLVQDQTEPAQGGRWSGS